MRKGIRIFAGLLALAMMIPMAACNSDNNDKGNENSSASSVPEGSVTDNTSSVDSEESADNTASSADTASSAAEQSAEADAETTSETLKGIFKALQENEDYKTYKTYYPDTTFEEKLVGDSIVINISGNDGVEGTCTFPVKDGFLECDVTPDDDLSLMIFNLYLLHSVGTYFGMNDTLFIGYTEYLAAINSGDYVVDLKEDGSGTIKLNIDKKPDVSALDDFYVTEEAAQKYYNEQLTNFTMNHGKILVYSVIGKDDKKTLQLAVGEYGEENTELTYKSVMSIVNTIKPDGYEDFQKDFTELKELKTDKYSVSFDSEAYKEETGVELNENYKFVIVRFGA